MNYRMFRIPHIPPLLKLKKLLLPPKTDEKQQCCQTNNAINPIVNKMKIGIYKKVMGLSNKNFLA